MIASTEDITNGWTTLYRTGDLGRWRPDGTLLIEGRISGDTQVKIRGYRVDLCEVEHAIIEAADGALLEAVVSKRNSETLRREFLIAHIVYNRTYGAVKDCIAEIRGRLGSRLPAYMFPAVIIPLERMPMTCNGKLDRRAVSALPIPESEKQVELHRRTPRFDRDRVAAQRNLAAGLDRSGGEVAWKHHAEPRFFPYWGFLTTSACIASQDKGSIRRT